LCAQSSRRKTGEIKSLDRDEIFNLDFWLEQEKMQASLSVMHGSIYTLFIDLRSTLIVAFVRTRNLLRSGERGSYNRKKPEKIARHYRLEKRFPGPSQNAVENPSYNNMCMFFLPK